MLSSMKRVIIPLMGLLLLSGCSTSQTNGSAGSPANQASGDQLVRVEFNIIKLYTEKYTDSGVLASDIDTDLKKYKGNNLGDFFNKYGNSYVETQVPLIQEIKKPTSIKLVTSTGYVSDIVNNSIVPNFYNDGFTVNIESNILSSGQIAVKYNITLERLKELEKSRKNKLVESPIMSVKKLEQSIIFKNQEYISTGVINTSPKQFEVIILRASKY